jgi:hypothetical protein
MQRRPRNDAFPQPANTSIRVRRYIDMAGLVSVLSVEKLPFIRIDQFNDPFEGSIPKSVDLARDPVVRGPDGLLNQLSKTRLFASCWHANEHESEAMWRLYCGQKDGIALQTTYEKLDQSLPHKYESGEQILLGMVGYRDYDSWHLPKIFNRHALYMNKRLAFAHEQEVRAIVNVKGEMTVTHLDGKVLKVQAPEDAPKALFIDWNAADCLEHVYVSPFASGWYRDAVDTVLKRFAPTLSDQLCWSAMLADPLY